MAEETKPAAGNYSNPFQSTAVSKPPNESSKFEVRAQLTAEAVPMPKPSVADVVKTVRESLSADVGHSHAPLVVPPSAHATSHDIPTDPRTRPAIMLVYPPPPPATPPPTTVAAKASTATAIAAVYSAGHPNKLDPVPSDEPRKSASTTRFSVAAALNAPQQQFLEVKKEKVKYEESLFKHKSGSSEVLRKGLCLVSSWGCVLVFSESCVLCMHVLRCGCRGKCGLSGPSTSHSGSSASADNRREAAIFITNTSYTSGNSKYRVQGKMYSTFSTGTCSQHVREFTLLQ